MAPRSSGNPSLRALASKVLDDNWLGRATKPAPHLYPHQWSWDSAFIAIGNARRHPDRATTELTQLFAAQWSTGLLPHIVFEAGSVGYFPSSQAWGSQQIEAAPSAVATSGICQPPIHAHAVRRVAIALSDRDRDRFLRSMYEPLAAWHGYLSGVRANDSALLEIWHPWESGMDNSPAWDAALTAMAPAAGDVPDYERADTSHAALEDRPTDRDYDRYMFLVEWLRQRHYLPPDPAEIPFRVRDVSFNAIFVQAEADLAWIARAVGADPIPHEEQSFAVRSAIESDLWNEELGIHTSMDARTGAAINTPHASSLIALLARPSSARVERIVHTLIERFAVPVGPNDGFVIPTVPLDDPDFEPTRYWRGPAWINVMWLIAQGLEDVGQPIEAERVRIGICDVVSEQGCFEYFDPTSMQGRGSDSFSWTAALTIDLLDRET